MGDTTQAATLGQAGRGGRGRQAGPGRLAGRRMNIREIVFKYWPKRIEYSQIVPE